MDPFIQMLMIRGLYLNFCPNETIPNHQQVRQNTHNIVLDMMMPPCKQITSHDYIFFINNSDEIVD